MNLKFALLSLFFFFVSNLTGQDFQDRLFKSYGFQFATGTMPAFFSNPNNQQDVDCYEVTDYLNFSFGLRYNIKDFNDDSSLSTMVRPGIGIPFGDFKSGNISRGGSSFNLPLTVSFNWGAGSTYNTVKNFGIGIGGGLDMNIFALLGESSDPDFEPKKIYLAPHTELTVRYWSKKKNRLIECYLRYNFMENEDGTDEFTNSSPRLIRFGFTTLLGY